MRLIFHPPMGDKHSNWKLFVAMFKKENNSLRKKIVNHQKDTNIFPLVISKQLFWILTFRDKQCPRRPPLNPFSQSLWEWAPWLRTTDIYSRLQQSTRTVAQIHQKFIFLINMKPFIKKYSTLPWLHETMHIYSASAVAEEATTGAQQVAWSWVMLCARATTGAPQVSYGLCCVLRLPMEHHRWHDRGLCCVLRLPLEHHRWHDHGLCCGCSGYHWSTTGDMIMGYSVGA